MTDLTPIIQRLDLLEALIERLNSADINGVVVAYTPTYTGGTTPGTGQTYSLQDGWYVRLGPVIHFWGRIAWTAAGTAAGTAQISLPVAAGTAASGTYRFSGSLYVTNVTIGTFSPEMLISQGASVFTMGQPSNNGANAPIVVEAAGDVIFSGTYVI